MGSKLDMARVALLPEETWLLMLTHLEAAVIARLHRASSLTRQRLSGADVAEWCAESRQALLKRRAVRGDMPLSICKGRWTLEQIHLCERPPRFPRIYFGFAEDSLDSRAMRRLGRVAATLMRHPKLRIRIEGFADPSAPDEIGRAISQARAVTVRAALLDILKQKGLEWHDEDPEEGRRAGGVRRQGGGRGGRRGIVSFTRESLSFYDTRRVGQKLQAIGRWGRNVGTRNENFAGMGAGDDGQEAQDESDQEYWRQFRIDDGGGHRRVDFTVLGIGDIDDLPVEEA